ncbi:PREDICTED: aspartate aminotransferase, mitochondrial-like [Amphimedon queenslandica]|uniref:Aspartate aminotransferase n=1 Tax=Amphimedon queenslandica TaxID=400682 RepID=A0AAN0JF65_AMPQE|nr:PREDICTED: aspartate aminotransferase, mitochondrial-like [Amphimedon queenslandica]|eukprot:XP_019855412.1 PREDICTED: aspartate aminotransferase, mitochondrial-like [Amphimedon queenslandica]
MAMLRTSLRSFLSFPTRAAAVRASSWWSGVEVGPPDPIFGLLEAYNKDERTNKVNLTVGAYRDDQGKPYVLNVVKQIERDNLDKYKEKEYAGILGYPSFHRAAIEFALTPQEKHVKENLYVSAQAIGGTGALRIIALFLAKFFPHQKTIYVPAPTWGNHAPVFRSSGLNVETYRHFKPETCGFDSEACYEDLRKIPDNSLILFHACGHNPTGIDPTLDEWSQLSKICKEKNHYVFMDMAYQGFSTGDLDRDASALRLFVRDGHQLSYAQSFSKNMGLYGERVGAVTILCDTPEEKAALESQLKIIVRPMYSNPPINGARIATEILTNENYRSQWLVEMKNMADRITSMRTSLKDALAKHGSTLDWSHVTKQIGMFCFSGLSAEKVDALRNEYGIYMTRDGRISMPALCSSNVDYVAKAIHEITK